MEQNIPERVLRPLAQLPEVQRCEVWEEAGKHAGGRPDGLSLRELEESRERAEFHSIANSMALVFAVIGVVVIVLYLVW